MGAVAMDGRADLSPEAFRAWLGDEISLHVAVKREHGDWFALIPEFDITGMGASESQAVQEAFELLTEYLVSHWRDGASFEDARRPIPRTLWLRIEGESALGRIARKISRRLPISSESTYDVPPGVIERFAFAQ